MYIKGDCTQRAHFQVPSRALYIHNRIGGIMVSVLTSSAVDRSVKPKSVELVSVASPLSTQH
jgi:hypothetical protein